MNTSGFAAQPERRFREVRRVLWLELLLNLFLAGIKITFGLWTRCMVIVADGVHSLSDGGSNVVGLVGTSIAGHPADEDHPYGHRKFETLAAFIVAFGLFAAAATIFKEAVTHLVRPAPPAEVNLLSFVLMGATLAANVAVAVWERRKGLELRSDLLLADSWHTFSDCFVTLSVFGALFAIQAGLPRVDTFVSMGIAVFIAFIAVRILLRSSQVLADRKVVDEVLVRSLVMKIKGVQDCHEIRSRGYADDMRIDLHILVDPHMSVEESHRIANIAEREIRAHISGVSEVLIHIEPSHHDHHELEKPT